VFSASEQTEHPSRLMRILGLTEDLAAQYDNRIGGQDGRAITITQPGSFGFHSCQARSDKLRVRVAAGALVDIDRANVEGET
jgi:hypothetical protein